MLCLLLLRHRRFFFLPFKMRVGGVGGSYDVGKEKQRSKKYDRDFFEHPERNLKLRNFLRAEIELRRGKEEKLLMLRINHSS